MNYTYFELDKNSKQFKSLKLGEYTIEFRIEWNVRSKAWFILGYIDNDLVLSNTKFEINQLYSFDKNITQNLPYNISVVPKFDDNNWDTPTVIIITDNFYADAVDGLTPYNVFIDREFGTSAFTHAKKINGSTRNAYLFDIELEGSSEEVVIVCADASDYMITDGLPTGRWDFTINGTRHTLPIPENDHSELITLFLGYGIEITVVDDVSYRWTNTTDSDIKVHAIYPFDNGYSLLIDTESNSSIQVINTDELDQVNEFAVCFSEKSAFSEWVIDEDVEIIYE